MLIAVLILSIIAAGAVADLFGKYFIAYRNYILSFSVSIVLTLICVHIIPEIFSYHDPHLGYYLLAGFLLQILLELLSKGIEHGHVHFHGKVSNNQMGVIFIGLCIHAIIEGMPMFTLEHEHHHLHEHKHVAFTWVYFTAILIHKLPIAVVLIFFLTNMGSSSFKKYALLALFSLTTPIGAVFGEEIMHLDIFSNWAPRLLALTTGMLLHITTLLIFEDHHHSNDKYSNVIIIVLGIGIGVLLF